MTEIFNNILNANLKSNTNEPNDAEILQSLLSNNAGINNNTSEISSNISSTGSQPILSRSTIMITLPDLHKLVIYSELHLKLKYFF